MGVGSSMERAGSSLSRSSMERGRGLPVILRVQLECMPAKPTSGLRQTCFHMLSSVDIR